MKKIISAFLVAVTVLSCCLFSSCGIAPPPLEDVKDELVALFEASYYVNEILFGAGLVTEYDLNSTKTEYTNEVKNAEGWYTDEQKFFTFYSPVVAHYMKDEDGDGFSEKKIEQPTSIPELKKICDKVYSEAFLSRYYNQVFVGDYTAALSMSSEIKPRYRDEYINDTVDIGIDGSTPAVTSEAPLRKYIFIDENNMNYIDSRGGRTVFDYDTMKILNGSSGDTLYVELLGFYQRKVFNTAEKNNYDELVSYPEYIWEKMIITFVLENGVWRLDTPTY